MDKETKHRLDNMVSRRICYVCGQYVPEPRQYDWRDLQARYDAPGTYHAGYHILVHRKACLDIVKQEERIYDRSARGRWRSPAQVRVRLRLFREGRLYDTTTPQAVG